MVLVNHKLCPFITGGDARKDGVSAIVQFFMIAFTVLWSGSNF